jgi:hypothetical protein
LEYAAFLSVLEDNFEYTRKMLTLGATRHNASALEFAPDQVFPGCEKPAFVELSRKFGNAELNTIERLLVLRSTAFSTRAPVQALANLASPAEQRQYSPGEPVFRRGQPSRALYVLLTGRVRVTCDAPRVEAMFEPIRLIAGLAAVGYEEHFYDAVAVTAVTALALPKEELFDVMEDHFGLTRAILAYTSQERERVMKLRQSRTRPVV